MALEAFWSAFHAADSHETGKSFSAFQAFLQTLRPVLEDEGQATLVILGRDFYLNDARIPATEAHQGIVAEFQRRGIAGIRVRRGATTAELKTFFALFAQPEVYTGTDLLAACTAYGSDRVLPAVDASIEAPDDNFEYDSEPQEAESSDREETPTTIAGASDFAPEPRRERAAETRLGSGNGIDLRRAKRSVMPIIEEVYSSGASKDPMAQGATEEHARLVCRLAGSMARFLDLDRRAAADLGVATLLQDIGRTAASDVQRHPLEGVMKIAGATTLNRTSVQAMRVALEHHMGFDGRGFPAGTPSLLSGLVAVADCFVSLRTGTAASGHGVERHQVLGVMLGPLRSRFHPLMLWALVKAVGIDPKGQRVELDDGSIAEVVKSDPSDLERPQIRLLVSAQGGPVRESWVAPLPASRTIRRALNDGESHRAT